MKKHLILLLIILTGACTGSGGAGPKEDCKVQYSNTGVVISQLKPDYSKTYVGGKIRYNLEVTNIGEKRAENIKVECKDISSELDCVNTAFNNLPFTLNPPDTAACIEGEVKQDTLTVDAQEPTGEEPAYLRLMLSYKYSSLSWSEVTLVSEAQWKVRTQQGIKPVQSAHNSASPVKIEIGVPDAPVVYTPGGKNEFPVTVILKNTVEGYAYPQTSSGDQYKVDSVTLTAPDNSNIEFASSECTYGATHKTCTLSNVPITTEDDAPKSRTVTAKITSFAGEEETYKINAEAKYAYIVKYASPQGVEIKAEYSP